MKEEKIKILRTAVYVRVSTEQQAKNGDSVDEQKSTCLDYVKQRENLVLADTYVDEGISGQKLERGEFQRLMDDVCDGKIDLIIFTKLDRWFRSLRHYLNTQEVLQKYGVDWIAVSQPFYDTTSPQGRAFVVQSMAFAELEAQSAGQRIRAIFDYKCKQGEVLSGATPLGYSIVDKHLCPNEDATKVVDMFHYFSETGNLSATTQYMASEYGIIRTLPNIKNMLQNKKYIGIFRDNENYCPPIIDRKLFDDVQNKLPLNIKCSQKHSYIFSGLVRCSCCNHAFSGTLRTQTRDRSGVLHQYFGYRCTYAYPRKLCDNRKFTYEGTLERYLLANVKPLLEEYLASYELKNAPVVDNSKKIAALNAKIEKLKELFLNDLITLDEYKEDKAKYLQQIEELPADQPSKDLSGLRKFLELDLESIYRDMSSEEKRYLWRSIIKEIHIDAERNIEIIFL